MGKGTLYWITGLSGAGKTTIGNALYYELKKKQDNLIILDGDILKKLVNEVNRNKDKMQNINRSRHISCYLYNRHV